MRRAAHPAVIAVALAAMLASGATAAPPPPKDLSVSGGEESWRADNRFWLEWENPANPSGPAIVAVHYLVRDSLGAIVVPDREVSWPRTDIEEVMVPPVPDAYTAEVWFRDSAGGHSPPASAKLRFDNGRPAQLKALETPDWLGRTAFPHAIRLDYPSSQIPVSGIAGYAISLDSSASGNPCAGLAHCTAAETDLHSGLNSDAFAIPALPEGTTHVHAVAVSGSGMRSIQPVHGVLKVDLTPPVTQVAGLPRGWTNGPVAITAIATDEGSGMEAGGQGPTPFTALRIDDGAPRTEPGASVSAAIIEEGVRRVSIYARDAAGNINDGGMSNGKPNPEPATALVRIERDPPSVAFSNFESPFEPELIHVQVHDSLSGPARQGSIGVRAAGSGDRFDELHTEPTPTGFRARWSSEDYLPGEYEFRAVGYDAAGNAGVTRNRANGARMVLSNPVKVPVALQAGFGGRVLVWHRCRRRSEARHCRREEVSEFTRRPAKRVVPFGRGAMFSGRLFAGVGVPVDGMEIQILERFPEGTRQAQRVSTVTTIGGGTFALRLPAGPSREVTAAFAGTQLLTRSATEPVQLGVRSDVSLRVSSAVARVGGRPLVFRGKVATDGTEMPSEGKTVQLQFRLPGLPWSEFRTIHTDRNGRFRYEYSFADDDSRGARFQFRAHAPAQGDWPYEPGSSRPVAVRGR